MAISNSALNEKFNPIGKIYKWVKYKFNFWKNNPFYFVPDGLVVFVGPQGSGKTLSAVNYVYNLLELYPNCKLVTNLKLNNYPFDNKRVFVFKDNDDLKKHKNGDKGVIFLIDEIQLYMNSLQSKNINMDVMTQISQQRKQRIHIVCTSQVFGRMAKPLREQFSNVIYCKNYLGFIQKNQLLDRDSIEEENSSDTQLKGKVKHTSWYIHSPEYYGRYDTYYVIDKNKFISQEKKGVDIYGTSNKSTSDN